MAGDPGVELGRLEHGDSDDLKEIGGVDVGDHRGPDENRCVSPFVTPSFSVHCELTWKLKGW